MWRTIHPIIFVLLLTSTVPSLGQNSNGAVAILKDSFPVSPGVSRPEHLAKILGDAGFAVSFLNGGQLADPQFLNRARFDLLVLPYGPAFPYAAASNFLRFLAQGGKFFSTGGYAFDQLLLGGTKGWKEARTTPESPINNVAWNYPIPAETLRGKGPITFSGWLKCAEVTGPGMAYYAIYQPAADGSLPEWRDLCKVTGSHGWSEFRYTLEVHPRARMVEIKAGLFRCRGAAWFDDVRLLDANGHVLADFNFEQPFEIDRAKPGLWTRSDPARCQVQSGQHHSGERALEARLDFQLARQPRLNTRFGVPADGLEVEPTQLGIFQADYLLRRAHHAKAASGQSILDPQLTVPGPLEGYAACGVVGADHARWLPLLNTLDRYERPRGAAGGLLRHYAGPYAGSSWAFFGITNRDLFAASNPGIGDALVKIARTLVHDTYAGALVPGSGCYRQGEVVEMLATLCNGGRTRRELSLKLEISPGEPGRSSAKAAAVLSGEGSVDPGATNLLRLAWEKPRLQTDFYHVVGRLYEGSNEIDRIESGFIVWNDDVAASGPPLRYSDNYLRLKKRSCFMFGTDDWGYVFNTARETPLQWLRDMRQRRDLGVNIYENLQFGLPASPDQQERLLRKVDGIVQLAQKYQQVYFPCLLCGYNVAASDTDLDRHKRFCGDFARRYASVPGLIYYLNGDLRCELSPAVTPQWNQFLRQRYPTDERLAEAWGPLAPSDRLGQLTATDFNDWGHEWNEVKVYDQNLFRAWLIRRWCGELVRSIRQHDPLHPTTAEFYQLPHQGVDLPAAMEPMDLANFGYFDRPGADISRFPAICKLNDQRAAGKSGGPGEYGVKVHPAWSGGDYGYHTARSPEQAMELFLAIAHYSLGLGASRIQNWCWKDDAHRVFPWGMIYPCDNVPRDTAWVHRNQSLLFRHFAPRYEPPSVYVLTPDTHRFGGGKWQVLEGILQAFNLALATHADNVGTLNEFSLKIPSQARVIFYPLPYCPPDDVYRQLLQWVRSGGVLYLSGDISYDEGRRRTRAARLEEFCGARFIGENYPNIALQPTNASPQPCIRVSPAGAQVLESAPVGSPLLLQHRVGSGTVIFTPEPIELRPLAARRAQDLGIYQRALKEAGVKPLGLQPEDPQVHAFRVALQDHGSVYVLYDTSSNRPPSTITLTDPSAQVSLTLAGRRPALAWLDRDGALRAVETHGVCRVGGEAVVEDSTGGIVLSLDGKDLRQSTAILLMPLRAGELGLSSSAGLTKPVLETGGVEDGSWQTYETSRLRPGKKLEVKVSSDQVFGLLLLCEEGEAQRWRTVLQERMRDPRACD